MPSKKINGSIYPEVAIIGSPGRPLDISSQAPLGTVSGLSVPEHDYISLTYAAGNLTGVEYRTDGPSGTIVGQLALAYDGSNNLSSVTRVQ